jgi:hypothetical protein
VREVSPNERVASGRGVLRQTPLEGIQLCQQGHLPVWQPPQPDSFKRRLCANPRAHRSKPAPVCSQQHENCQIYGQSWESAQAWGSARYSEE